MKSSPKSARRVYESPLRKDQADATRTRLVEAVLAEANASGTGDVSMLAVARRARVAAPTVYRHFPTKKDLFVALQEHVASIVPPPRATGVVATDIRALFRWRGATQEAFGPFASSSFIWELRRAVTVPARRPRWAEIVSREVPGLAEPTRTWLIDLLIVVVSDAMVQAFRGYLDLDPDAAADRAIWTVEALFERGRREVAAAAPRPADRKPPAAKATAKAVAR